MSSTADTLNEESATIIERTHAQMSATVAQSGYSLKERIAGACRFLADSGHAATLAGQITVRNEDESFWTTGFASGLADATPDNLVRVNENLEVLEGPGMANPGTRFHSWVYRARPEVRAIVHTHPPHISALALSGQKLVVSHMDMTMFHDDVAYLEEWPGVPLANEEGRIISGALGAKNTIILVNHGMLTVGTSLEHAVFLAAYVELAAKMQILAQAAGHQPIPVADALAADAKTFVTSPKFVQATFDYWFRQTLRHHPDLLASA